MGENSGKICVNLGKMCENVRKIAVCAFILLYKNGTPNQSADIYLFFT